MGNTLGPIGGAALGIGSGIADGLANQIFGELDMKRQLRGQKQALQQQNEANLDYWHKTNYGAQMKELKAAGLNPALIYGMGGAGGQTGTASAMPSSTGSQTNVGMGMMQGAMMSAQIENIKADTQNKLGDAANKPKVGSNLDADTKRILEETNNLVIKGIGMKLDNALSEIEVKYQGDTLQARVQSTKDTADQIKTQLDLLRNQKDISDATKQTVIKQVWADYVTTLLEQEATKAGTKLTQAQTDQIRAEIEQMDDYLNIATFNANTGRDQANTAHDNMITGAKRLEFDKRIHNVTDATKLTVETITDVVDMAGEYLIGKGIGKALKATKEATEAPTPSRRRARYDKWGTRTKPGRGGYDLK